MNDTARPTEIHIPFGEAGALHIKYEGVSPKQASALATKIIALVDETAQTPKEQQFPLEGLVTTEEVLNYCRRSRSWLSKERAKGKIVSVGTSSTPRYEAAEIRAVYG